MHLLRRLPSVIATPVWLGRNPSTHATQKVFNPLRGRTRTQRPPRPQPPPSLPPPLLGLPRQPRRPFPPPLPPRCWVGRRKGAIVRTSVIRGRPGHTQVKKDHSRVAAGKVQHAVDFQGGHRWPVAAVPQGDRWAPEKDVEDGVIQEAAHQKMGSENLVHRSISQTKRSMNCWGHSRGKEQKALFVVETNWCLVPGPSRGRALSPVPRPGVKTGPGPPDLPPPRGPEQRADSLVP